MDSPKICWIYHELPWATKLAVTGEMRWFGEQTKDLPNGMLPSAPKAVMQFVSVCANKMELSLWKQLKSLNTQVTQTKNPAESVRKSPYMWPCFSHMETCLSICAPPSGQGLAPEFRPQKTPWPGSSWLEEVVIHDKPTHGTSALGASMRVWSFHWNDGKWSKWDFWMTHDKLMGNIISSASLGNPNGQA